MYTRNDWYVACAESRLSPDRPIATCILDEALVVWQSADKVVAFEDRCVHRAAALSLGRCEGDKLRCLYHGLLFDDTGMVVEIPGQNVIPPAARVRTYPAIVRYGLVWVWMGDLVEADPDRLPALLPGVRFEDFIMSEGVLDFQAEARLVSDNLLDFSHLSYVHADSFQASGVWAKSMPAITQLERGVRVERWLENAGPSGQPAPHDHWLGYDYLIPGVLVMWGGNFEAGTARALNFGRPDLASSGTDVALQIQTITPMTERTSRYHFCAGVHRERTTDLSMAEKFIPVAELAFNEDRSMIEAQQRVIDRDPERPIMPTAHDRGVVMYNRLKSRLIANELSVEGAKANRSPP